MNAACTGARVLPRDAWRLFCASVLVVVIGACRSETVHEKPVAADAHAEAVEESGHTWPLEDGSKLRVLVQPWPPKSDETTDVFVELDQGDWSNRDYQARVRFRLATSPDSDAPWLALTPAHEDDATLYFRHTVTLPSGRRYIQFEIARQGFSQPNVLRDWCVEVP